LPLLILLLRYNIIKKILPLTYNKAPRFTLGYIIDIS